MFDPLFSEGHLNPVLVFIAIKQVDIATHIELRAVYNLRIHLNLSVWTRNP